MTQRKKASLEQHVEAAKHIRAAHQSIDEAMRALGVLDYVRQSRVAFERDGQWPPPSQPGRVTAKHCDALINAHRSLDKLRMKLAAVVDKDHWDRTGHGAEFLDGYDLYARAPHDKGSR